MYGAWRSTKVSWPSIRKSTSETWLSGTDGVACHVIRCGKVVWPSSVDATVSALVRAGVGDILIAIGALVAAGEVASTDEGCATVAFGTSDVDTDGCVPQPTKSNTSSTKQSACRNNF